MCPWEARAGLVLCAVLQVMLWPTQHMQIRENWVVIVLALPICNSTFYHTVVQTKTFYFLFILLCLQTQVPLREKRPLHQVCSLLFEAALVSDFLRNPRPAGITHFLFPQERSGEMRGSWEAPDHDPNGGSDSELCEGRFRDRMNRIRERHVSAMEETLEMTHGIKCQMSVCIWVAWRAC